MRLFVKVRSIKGNLLSIVRRFSRLGVKQLQRENVQVALLYLLF